MLNPLPVSLVRYSPAQLACLLVFSFFFTGCGFYVSIKEPTEPFLASQRLAEVIQLDTEKFQATPEHFRDSVAEVLPEKLERALKEGGLVGEVRRSPPASGGSLPTLKIVTKANLDAHVGSRVFKAILGVILFPLLPFFDAEYTWTLSAEILIADKSQAIPTTVSSEMVVTYKVFASDAYPIQTFPTVAEDLSWKIARELKRHPDWLRPPSTATIP